MKHLTIVARAYRVPQPDVPGHCALDKEGVPRATPRGMAWAVLVGMESRLCFHVQHCVDHVTKGGGGGGGGGGGRL